ncbi:MAG TPA: sigma 54-interacting transcriptional regulator [Spirochaetota bacterium]|nr:sigma 54-interacting transcriptional regulator [Spirochaetota bacterium]
MESIILDSIADGVFTVDMDFRITSMNRAAGEILGIRERDALGKLCFEVFHANICEHSCALKETMATGSNIINKTIYIVNSKGDRVPISVSTALLKNEGGEIIGGVETFRDLTPIETLRKEIELKYSFEDMVSKNREMRDLFSILPDIAASSSSVLVEGPSGTGKELVARAIHSLSPRKANPLVIINCTAVPDNLLESELFGYKAGAFTDAKKDKPGKISLAERGTLFLDEIGDISPAIQAKLLRFLQDKTYEPLGDNVPVKSDVRIVSATNKTLIEEVKKGTFREDLFYRLNVINLRMPSLSERTEDIPLLVSHFIKKYNILTGKNIEGVSDDVMNILMDYDYPGNIRELENIIEHAFVLCRESYIRREHLPKQLRTTGIPPDAGRTLEEMEQLYINRALEKNSGNRTRAAQDLGIDTSTLWRKMKKYGIEP